jgi:thiol-disulfide isomerase/thioredoxin
MPMADLIFNDRPRKKRSLGIAFFIMGVFLIGTVFIFLLTNAQQLVLKAAEIAILPATNAYAAPAISLSALDGNAVSLVDYKDKVVLVNNWATWCPPCKDEMPVLQAYYQAHKNDGFVVVGIESGETAAEVADFVQSLGMSFPVWLDPHGAAVAAFKNWDLPSSYVIDRSGMVCLSWTGPLNKTTLEKYITPLLEK